MAANVHNTVESDASGKTPEMNRQVRLRQVGSALMAQGIVGMFGANALTMLFMPKGEVSAYIQVIATLAAVAAMVCGAVVYIVGGVSAGRMHE